MQQRQCTQCERISEVSPRTKFCRYCGTPFEVKNPESEEVVASPNGVEVSELPPPNRDSKVVAVGNSDAITTPLNQIEAAGSGLEPENQTSLDRPKATNPTKPLRSENTLQPLQAGAVLQERFQIREFLPDLSKNNCNYYSCFDLQYFLRCLYCGYQGNLEGDSFCGDCGSSLNLQQSYLAREVLALGQPTGEALLSSAGLGKADGLIPEFINFLEQNRAYSLRPGFGSNNQKLEEFGSIRLALGVQWADQLIKFLVQFHQQKLMGINLSPKNLIVLSGEGLQVVEASQVHAATDKEDFQPDLKQVLDTITFISHKRAKALSEEELPFEDIWGKWEMSLQQPTTISDAAALEAFWQAAQPTALPKPLTRLFSRTGWNAGLHRDNNEDAVLNLELTVQSELQREPAGLYLVADGMGGHENGEVASALTLKLMYNSLAPLLGQARPSPALYSAHQDDIMQRIGDAIHQANLQIIEQGQGKMGTTLTLCFIQHTLVYVANVGDSRTYLYRQGELSQLTEDDSLVYRMMMAGQISREAIYSHDKRNQLLRSLGDSGLDSVDIKIQLLESGDRLLLCSDGLWEMVRDAQIREILANSTSPAKACQQLVEAANHNGGEDNIGLIVVEVE